MLKTAVETLAGFRDKLDVPHLPIIFLIATFWLKVRHACFEIDHMESVESRHAQIITDRIFVSNSTESSIRPTGTL